DPSLRVIARLFRYDKTKDKALLDQAESIVTEVQSPHVWLNWAEVVAEAENFPKKLNRVYKHVVGLDGHDARTWLRIGKLQYYLGKVDEAESAYRKSIALDPNVSTTWNGLAYILIYGQGRVDEAEAAYRRAIELDPGDANPWFGLGDLLQTYLKKY